MRAQTMLRVGDLDKSIQYYTEALGMKVIRKSENESQKYTLAFLGYGEEEDNVLIELTYNWGKGSEAYTKGDAYAQIALSTEVRALPCPSRWHSYLSVTVTVMDCLSSNDVHFAAVTWCAIRR